jgi:hypothetical protein
VVAARSLEWPRETLECPLCKLAVGCAIWASARTRKVVGCGNKRRFRPHVSKDFKSETTNKLSDIFFPIF